MLRRAYLASIGAGSVCSLGGCLDGIINDGETDKSAVPEIDSQRCPPYEIDGRAVCSHTVDESAALVFLDAFPTSSPLQGGRPLDDITLELHNQTELQMLRFNPGAWVLYRYSEEGWAEIPREQIGDGVIEVPPGETRQWTFLEAAGLILHEPSFEPGLYATQLNVGQVYDPGTAERENTIMIALVRLESPT